MGIHKISFNEEISKNYHKMSSNTHLFFSSGICNQQFSIVKPALNSHSKVDKIKVLKTGGR